MKAVTSKIVFFKMGDFIYGLIFIQEMSVFFSIIVVCKKSIIIIFAHSYAYKFIRNSWRNSVWHSVVLTIIKLMRMRKPVFSGWLTASFPLCLACISHLHNIITLRSGVLSFSVSHSTSVTKIVMYL